MRPCISFAMKVTPHTSRAPDEEPPAEMKDVLASGMGVGKVRLETQGVAVPKDHAH